MGERSAPFRIGDRVRVRVDQSELNGLTGTVVPNRGSSRRSVRVQMDRETRFGHYLGFDVDELELYQEPLRGEGEGE